MTKRKSYRINKAGSIKNLTLVEEELPDPAKDEVTVEVKSIGLNFADLFAIQGLYSATPKQSFIPGLEYSGRVIKRGTDVTEFNKGDGIIGAIRFGAYTTHLNINKRYILKLPENYSLEMGAAAVVQPLTAFYSLVELGNIKEGNTILVNSAAGGVGIYANRIAKRFKAFTIGTVGNKNKINFFNCLPVRDISCILRPRCAVHIPDHSNMIFTAPGHQAVEILKSIFGIIKGRVIRLVFPGLKH